MRDEWFASVWDATEDTPAAESMKLWSALMIALKEQIERASGLDPQGKPPSASA